ncbi:hypothetical protein A2875_05475 [Candidatus Gottesmanbacteria bacterium RIFCSPHIGHO2_01_FULL_46_14]|uniref:Aspartate racemase n=2 Tax=Candidatus Gottesmaniibacteriota TaxID=1752720 RepID=A0A1F5ZKK4_9BACT|nr:MAG: hypothetical protein A2875_05475 [Candidatus Gottesmanbacteria bacterium RIFCSPHIGHO2_01_FULL_46_14]OGG28600.1 MAG: hypothetical protein A2971_01770 [Candidatus Gottesmanbacteria bacterium RIFCSPLOWO2_01_FULL_46_21]
MKQPIGIIGGMGPQASSELYRLLIERARANYGVRTNDAYPEILIDSVPVPDFLSDTDQMEQAAKMLEDRVGRLTRYGIGSLTLACNTACILIDRLQKRTNVPIISVIDEVANRINKSFRVLLLASPTSLRMKLYQNALSSLGILFVVPKEEDYGKIELIIRGVLDDDDRQKLMKQLVEIADRYRKETNVDGIVLGCTELPLVFPDRYPIQFYSSLSILADVLLKRYYTEEVV